MKSILSKINQLIRIQNRETLPSVFWRGAFVGLWVLCMSVMILTGTFYRVGIPTWLVATGTFLIGLGTFWLLRVIGALVHKGLVLVPAFVFSIIFAVAGTLLTARFVRFGLPGEVFYWGALLFILASILLFGASNILYNKKTTRSWPSLIAIGGSLVAIFGCIYFLAQEGKDPYEVNFSDVAAPLLSAQGINNPGTIGAHKIDHFTYGSGTDQQREEYNKEVRFVTPNVNASRLLPEWKGSKAKWRERFWGFGVKEFPLNGRVWMPIEKKNCPIILIVHGNHGMEEFSDPGYAYLGELLASRGFIVVSVDENFINATWSGDFRGREMPARGWLLLKHLEQWRTWSSDSKHELFQKADLGNVILAGHSRGGEAAPIATHFNKLPYFPDDANEKFDFNFGIKGVVAIAPTDKRYDRRIHLKDVNYLTIQGSYDSDEASFFGFRQFQRVTFLDSAFHFKAGLYVHQANHGQFNTVWGKYDGGPPSRWLLNTAPQIPIEDQMKIAKVYISAFAEVTLNGHMAYNDLFINSATGADWLPKAILMNTWEDSHMQKQLDFEEDLDLTTGSQPGISLDGKNLKVWREATLKFRDQDTQGNNAVILGWAPDSLQQKASYEVTFGKSLAIDNIESIMMSLAAGDPSELKKESKKDSKKPDSSDEPEVKFNLLLIDSVGNQIAVESNKLKKLKPRLKVQFLKLKGLSEDNYGTTWEPTLETFAFSLEVFNPAKNTLSGIKKVIFDFPADSKGVLILDDISVLSK